jgi:hypothetical protein
MGVPFDPFAALASRESLQATPHTPKSALSAKQGPISVSPWIEMEVGVYPYNVALCLGITTGISRQHTCVPNRQYGAMIRRFQL